MQPDLPLFAVSPEDPNVEWLVAWLDQRGWVRSADIIAAMGRDQTEQSLRLVRALAAASSGRIASAPGTLGYKRTDQCTPEDIERVRSLKNQSREMLRRYIHIMRVWHRTPHGSAR